MSDTPDPHLLHEIESFLASTGMKEWAFGRKAVNDPKLVDQVRAGRELRKGTRDRVLAYLAEARREQ